METEIICRVHGRCRVPVIEFGGTVIKPSCPICEQEKEKEEQKEKERKRQEEYIKHLEDMGIRKMFFDATFENFKAETESQKQLLQACKDLCDGKIKKVIVMGGNGIGKTHLSCACLKKMGGKRYNAYELFSLYRECYSSIARKSEMALIKEIASYSLVVIDELGRTKASKAEINFFSALIDELHSQEKSIMIISNKVRKYDCPSYKKSKESCKTCAKPICIERYLDSDILSRLSQDSVKITVTGRDYRRSEN